MENGSDEAVKFLERDFNQCFAQLRHYDSLEGGADIRYIQQLLGHAKLNTTAIYTETSIGKLQEIHAKSHPSEKRRALPKSEVNDEPDA